MVCAQKQKKKKGGDCGASAAPRPGAAPGKTKTFRAVQAAGRELAAGRTRGVRDHGARARLCSSQSYGCVVVALDFRAGPCLGGGALFALS
jgi:hypothetical protein